MKKEVEHNIFYKIYAIIVKFLYFILYHPKIINADYIPKKGAVILAGNHVNNLDPCNILYCSNRIVRFLAKSELFQPWYGFIFKTAGCISVNCDGKSPDAVEKAINALKNDYAVGIFPEGRVKREPEVVLGPFKNGVIKIAKETDCPIVPFAIVGKRKYKLFFNDMKVIFAKPVKVTDMSYQEANKYLYDIIYNLIIENETTN